MTSSRSVYELAVEHGVEMPITRAVFDVCHNGLAVADMVGALMGRSKKAE